MNTRKLYSNLDSQYSYTQSMSTGNAFLTNDYDLNGNGLMIGLILSGINSNNCFFADNYYSPPYQTTNSYHRKIYTIQYDYNDKTEYYYYFYYLIKYSDGTYLASIVAGSDDSSLSSFYISFYILSMLLVIFNYYTA